MDDGSVIDAARAIECVLARIAAALADDRPDQRVGVAALDDLAAIVASTPAEVIAPLGADIAACWKLRGLPLPPALAALAPTGSLQPPAIADWEVLGSWYADHASLAQGEIKLPDADALALVRAVAAALLADDVERAGRLLRWLALAPTPYDRSTANAIGAAVTRAPRTTAALLHVVAAHRTWQCRTIKELGGPPPPTPAPGDVEVRPAPLEVADAAIAWFVRQRDDFVTGDRSMKQVRKLGELGVLADVLLRHGPKRGRPDWTTTGEELLRHAWKQLEDGRALVEMIEAKPEMAINVTVYWLFHRHGLRNAALEDAIEHNAHRIPNQIAYLGASAMQEIGLKPPWPVEEAYGWTVVGRGLPPWRLLPIEVYLVTHVAFYNARFGDAHRPFEGREYLRRWLPVWLRHYQRIGAYDLLAEMVFTWHCVEDVCCAPDIWSTLVAAQARDGRIPFSRDTSGDDYHSTLMTITAALHCEHR